MKCKPEDIARILVGPNRDRLVRVIELDTRDAHPLPAWWCEALQHMQWMDINGVLHVDPPGACGYLLDEELEPLRDVPGEDETFTWAGKPNTIPTKETERV